MDAVQGAKTWLPQDHPLKRLARIVTQNESQAQEPPIMAALIGLARLAAMRKNGSNQGVNGSQKNYPVGVRIQDISSHSTKALRVENQFLSTKTRSRFAIVGTMTNSTINSSEMIRNRKRPTGKGISPWSKEPRILESKFSALKAGNPSEIGAENDEPFVGTNSKSLDVEKSPPTDLVQFNGVALQTDEENPVTPVNQSSILVNPVLSENSEGDESLGDSRTDRDGHLLLSAAKTAVEMSPREPDPVQPARGNRLLIGSLDVPHFRIIFHNKLNKIYELGAYGGLLNFPGSTTRPRGFKKTVRLKTSLFMTMSPIGRSESSAYFTPFLYFASSTVGTFQPSSIMNLDDITKDLVAPISKASSFSFLFPANMRFDTNNIHVRIMIAEIPREKPDEGHLNSFAVYLDAESLPRNKPRPVRILFDSEIASIQLVPQRLSEV